MIGGFWNIRGLNKTERHLMLANFIRNNHLDFVGIVETKKSVFQENYLKFLSDKAPFVWNFLPSVGSAGDILAGFNSDLFNVTVNGSLKSLLNLMLTDRKSNFVWRFIVVYGSPYEEGK